MDGKASSWQARANLRRLALLRLIAAALQAIAIFVAYEVAEIRVPLAPLTGTLVFLAVAAAATSLRAGQAWPVTHAEIFGQLLLDAGALTFMLYFTGGAINPFAALYLLIVLYATVALPPRLAWALAAICMLGYAALHFFHVPLPLSDAALADRTLNYFAHFIIYLALAALVAGYGLRLREMRRLHFARVQADAEKDARERYLLGLAALSAGTAHEISTPLSTMQVVVDELRRSAQPPPEWKEAIDVLWKQIELTRRSLDTLAHSAHVERLGKVENVRAAQFVLELAERFRALHPHIPLRLQRARLDDTLMMRSDHTLPQGVLNFLGNAADASPHAVEMRAGLKDELRLSLEVLDRGPGIPPALRERIGKGLITTKESGSGAGVLVGRAAVERFGGTVHISDRQRGGTKVQIELPLFRQTEKMGKDDEYRGLRIA